MLSFYNIWTVAKFELKTLSRSWFFRIFGVLSIIILAFFNLVSFTNVTGGFIPRMMYGITASIPYANLLFFNLAQAVIAVFLASDFLKRDKKLDTTEAIYIRSINNSDYVLGKSAGVILIFFALNLIVLLQAAIFNFLNSEVNFNLAAYLYYLLLINFPTLIFIIGLSFLSMTIFRNQAVTFILLLGYIGTTLFYLGGKFYHVFDYTGFYIPLMYSDFIGFGNLRELLILRGAYFLWGLSFIFLTMFFFKRLPQSELIKKASLVFSILLIASGILLIASYVGQYTSGENLRSRMIELNNKYVDVPRLPVSKCDLSVQHEREIIKANAEITVVNDNTSSASELVFNLNPGLSITSITSDGETVEFKREEHLLILNCKPIEPGRHRTFSFKYSGLIDEEACYLDIDNKKREEPNTIAFYMVDKRYAIINPEYVLLTPENMWYPQSGVTFIPESQFRNTKDFIDFTLNVQTKEDLTVISQGEKTDSGKGRFTFKPENPLPQLSLIIGKYEKRSVKVDSVEYNLYTYKDHNYFDNYLTEIDDTLSSLIKELKLDYEREINLEYPYPRFSLVETPVQFTKYPRTWTRALEPSQPEITMLPENAVGLDDADFKMRQRMQERFGNRSNQVTLPRENQSSLFNRFVRSALMDGPTFFRFGRDQSPDVNVINPYSIFPNFFNYVNNFVNTQQPLINNVLENYLRVEQEDSSPFMRRMFGLTPSEIAMQKLKEGSLSELVKDTTYNRYISEILKLKGSYLFTELESEIGQEEFRGIIKGILVGNHFRNGGYEELAEILRSKYNIDLNNIMDEWYNSSVLPGYFISKMRNFKFVDVDRERYQVIFNITNTSEIDGFVNLTLDPRRGGGGGRFMRMLEGGQETSLEERTIAVNPNQTKTIGVVLNEAPGRLTVNTLLSVNLPISAEFPFEEFEEDKKASGFDGEKILDQTEEYKNPDEVIVDNEDPGFIISNPEQKSFLKKILNLDVEEDKYIGLRSWNTPEDWRATIVSEAYGEFIHSACYTKAGDGSIKVEWKTELSESGYYDVYVYLTKPRIRFRRNESAYGEYHYTISSDDGADEVALDVDTYEPGWNLLGSYYISDGETKVELSNKSKTGVVIADAVKWIKRK